MSEKDTDIDWCTIDSDDLHSESEPEPETLQMEAVLPFGSPEDSVIKEDETPEKPDQSSTNYKETGLWTDDETIVHDDVWNHCLRIGSLRWMSDCSYGMCYWTEPQTCIVDMSGIECECFSKASTVVPRRPGWMESITSFFTTDLMYIASDIFLPISVLSLAGWLTAAVWTEV